MKPALHGAVAGLAGTVFMTIAMRWLWRRLPENQRYPLPPREIIESALTPAAKARMGERTRRNLTMVAHFGYGAATAIPFALGTESRRASAGAAYGLAVWAGSYLGWIPAMRILKPATEHPAKRNLLMMLAHLIWGASMAVALRRVERAQTAALRRRRDPRP